MLRLELLNTRLHLAVTGLLVVPFFRDRIPLKGLAGWVDWVLCGQLSRAIAKGGLTGAKGEKAILMGYRKFRAERVMAYGLGEAKEALPLTLEGMFTEIVGVVQEMGYSGFATPTMILDFPRWDYGGLVRPVIRGVYQGCSFAGRSLEGKFVARIIEENFNNLEALENAAREVMAQYRDKLDSEIVLREAV